MLIVLPLMSFSLLYLLILQHLQNHQSPTPYRWAFSSASIGWGSLLALGTEFLSLFHAITPLWIALFWLTLCVILSILFYVRRQLPIRRPDVSPALERFEIGLLIAIIALVLIATFVAWMAPPNTADSMAYHMPRVVHWMQNQTVNHYPTHIDRQLYQGTWAEYTILHFQLLLGSDHLANFVQWFSMVGSLLGVSLIAKQLGANRRAQIMTAAICATLPVGILESTSTQTDYVIAFWLVCLTNFVLKVMLDGLTWLRAILIAACLGLSLVSKGSAYVFALPVMVLFGAGLLRAFKWRWLPMGAVMLLIVVLLNAPYWLRNYQTFGSPLGIPGAYSNKIFGPQYLASNLARNVVMNAYAPTGASREWIMQMLVGFHEMIGVALLDPRTTLQGPLEVPSLWSDITFHEDHAGNLLHMLLYFAVLITGLIAFKKLSSQHRIYLALIVALPLLFAAIFLWQPWVTRLQLPAFVLFSPAIALILEASKAPIVRNGIMVLLLISAIPFAIGNQMRPILWNGVYSQYGLETNTSQAYSVFSDRDRQYFRGQRDMYPIFSQVADQVADSNCTEVGYMSDSGGWQYPMWALLKQRLPEVRLEHINAPIGGTLELSYQPCAIIRMPGEHPSMAYAGIDFVPVISTSQVTLLLPSMP